jgi:hypothetical protein
MSDAKSNSRLEERGQLESGSDSESVANVQVVTVTVTPRFKLSKRGITEKKVSFNFKVTAVYCTAS